MYEPQSDFQDWCNANLRQIACSKEIRMLLAQAFEGGRVAEREARAKVCDEAINHDYERGFVDGMNHQARSSVDRAVNATAAVKLADAYQKGWNDAMLRSSLGMARGQA